MLAPDLPAAGRRQRDEGPRRAEWTALPAPMDDLNPGLCHGSSARRVPLPRCGWVDRDLRELGRALPRSPQPETLQERLGFASLSNMSRSHLCELVHGLGRAGPPSGLRGKLRGHGLHRGRVVGVARRVVPVRVPMSVRVPRGALRKSIEWRRAVLRPALRQGAVVLWHLCARGVYGRRGRVTIMLCPRSQSTEGHAEWTRCGVISFQEWGLVSDRVGFRGRQCSTGQQVRENSITAHVFYLVFGHPREGDHARIIREGASQGVLRIAGLRPRVLRHLRLDGGLDVLHGREDGERGVRVRCDLPPGVPGAGLGVGGVVCV